MKTAQSERKLERKVAGLERAERRMSEELRHASEALRESEERFRDLFDEAPIAYVHEGLDSRFIRANRVAIRILGIKPEEIAGTFGKSLVPRIGEFLLATSRAEGLIVRVRVTSGLWSSCPARSSHGVF